MLTLAAFKFIDTGKWVDPHVYDMPEGEPYSPSFEYCDYDGKTLLENASSTVWLYKAHIAVLVVLYGPFWLINRRWKCSGRCDKTNKKC